MLNGAPVHHNRSVSNELFLLKQEMHVDRFSDKIMELPSDSLERTPTQLLFNVGNKILNETFVRMNADVPHQAGCLLKNILQVIEERFSNHTESLKTQNNLFKVREGKYQARINALETLVAGTTEENEVVTRCLQKSKIALQHEKTELEKKKEQDLAQFKRDKVRNEIELSALKQEFEKAKKAHDEQCSLLELHLSESKAHYEKRIEENESHLANARTQVKELKTFLKSKSLKWKDEKHTFESFLNGQSEAFHELRGAMESVKLELLKSKRSYSEELKYLGMKLKGLVEAAKNYHEVLAENRKLYNEVQDMKGTIRVYCRIRPFLPGQSQKQSTIEFVGDNGELIVDNPLKPGSESLNKLFKFNKVFDISATQEDIYADIQPLIRSVLDGYNVCIFAYGQTGSGKTYTMSGPSLSLRSKWGVNYRALHDLFEISQSRRGSINYEVGVQMVEIYNEVVRDLLSSKGPQKRLGIWNSAQPKGLVVPDASMHSVSSMKDVLELMNIGQMNRATSVTALNERSSRSHSVLTVHVRGTDLGTNTILRSCLHLIDLAGSERVDRSEATGDRLKEAQHINKSLSALGDVIFALAQKSQHVPYRNSKLTQVLQSSLGGQAKTLMFVQINPDIASYSETISTLKFAKRVSGVELGAARSSKEGKDVRQLMEQLTYLKDAIAKKDEEIDRLQMLKANHESSKQGMTSARPESSVHTRQPLRTPRPSQKLSGISKKPASDMSNYSEYGEKYSEQGSIHNSLYEPRKNLGSLQLKLAREDRATNFNENDELLGIGDANLDERLSDISDGDLSMGTETDLSTNSIVEFSLFPEVDKSGELTTPARSITESIPVEKTEKFTMLSSIKTSRGTQVPHRAPLLSSRLPLNRSSPKVTSSVRKPTTGSSSLKPPKR